MEKQTFEIPKWCSKVTVEQIGNQIVTTFEPENKKFKKGDVIISSTNAICILKGEEAIYGGHQNVYCRLKDENLQFFDYDYNCSVERYANEDEKQKIFSAINKLGYEYNFETHEAKKLKWKPEYGEEYYFLDSCCKIDRSVWHDDGMDMARYNIGNCYRTNDEAIPRQQHYLSFKD